MDALSPRRPAIVTSRGSWLLVCGALLTGCSGPTPLGPSGPSISGVVLDWATRTPVAGVTVVATGSGPGPGVTATGMTNSAGAYTIGGLKTGEFVVSATKAGYEVRSQTVTVQANTNTTLDVELIRSTGHTLSGVVTEITSAGIVPVHLALLEILDRPHQTGSNAAGAYSIVNVPLGAVTIRATRQGYRAYVQPLVLTGDTQHDIALVRHVLSGRVFEMTPNGPAAVADALVAVSVAGPSGPKADFEPRTSMRTDSGGRYRLEAPTATTHACGDLSPTADLHVFKTGYVPINTRVSIDGDTPLDIEISRQ